MVGNQLAVNMELQVGKDRVDLVQEEVLEEAHLVVVNQQAVNMELLLMDLVQEED